MTPAHISMKSLHPRRIVASQGRHLTGADHRLVTRLERIRRSKHVSFGNRVDAIGEVNAVSAMRGNNPDRQELQRLLGLHRVIRREREAGVPTEARTDPHVRKDQGGPGTADPQRGIKVSLILQEHPRPRFV